jgi:O-antigen ligase
MLPLALALFLYYRPRRQSAVSPAQAFLNLYSRGKDNRHLFFILASYLIVLALLLSKSRGGVFCALLSLVLFVILGRKHVALVGLLPAVLGLILLVGGTDVGRDGLSTAYQGFRTALLKDGASINGRLAFWKNAVHIVSDFPLTGTGAGTFQDVYPHYDRHPGGDTPLHAHNDYL